MDTEYKGLVLLLLVETNSEAHITEVPWGVRLKLPWVGLSLQWQPHWASSSALSCFLLDIADLLGSIFLLNHLYMNPSLEFYFWGILSKISCSHLYLTKPCEVNVIIYILQMRKPSLRRW